MLATTSNINLRNALLIPGYKINMMPTPNQRTRTTLAKGENAHVTSHGLIHLIAKM